MSDFIEIFDFREKILMRDPGIPRNHTLLAPKMGLCNREYENSPISQKMGLCNREYEKYTIFIEIFDFCIRTLPHAPVRDRAPLSERPGGFFACGISLSLEPYLFHSASRPSGPLFSPIIGWPQKHGNSVPNPDNRLASKTSFSTP